MGHRYSDSCRLHPVHNRLSIIHVYPVGMFKGEDNSGQHRLKHNKNRDFLPIIQKDVNLSEIYTSEKNEENRVSNNVALSIVHTAFLGVCVYMWRSPFPELKFSLAMTPHGSVMYKYKTRVYIKRDKSRCQLRKIFVTIVGYIIRFTKVMTI